MDYYQPKPELQNVFQSSPVRLKLLFSTIGMLAILLAAQALGQDAKPSEFASRLPDSPNIIYAMLGQVLNNPSSLLVVAFLCVVCWLCDDLPWPPSKYVPHLSVIVGASMYWMFTSEATVPKVFPHPYAVFAVNGVICGFVAYIIHRQVVARVMDLFKPKI